MDMDLKANELKANELKAHKNEINKKSYEKQKIKIARVRILKRIANGSNVDEKTINNPIFEWTDEEKLILESARKNNKSLYYVEKRSEEFIKEFSSNVSLLSKGNYKLHKEDMQSEGYLFTKNNTNNLLLSFEDCENEFHRFVNVEKTILMNKKKGDIQRKLIIKSYTNRLQMLLDIYGTDNVLELYQNPERLHNKLVTSHLLLASVKDYISVLMTLYIKKAKVLRNGSYVELNTIIHKDQINHKIRPYVKSGILLSKANETYRHFIEPYYSWVDIKKLPLMLSILPDTELKYLRDKVLVNFYIKESVLRDNLGSVRVIYESDTQRDRDVLLKDVKTNVLDLRTCILTIKDFKTNNTNDELLIHVSKETIDIVNKYLDLTYTKTKTKPKYLITKNDGTMYLDGKISGYIRDMFNKYTGVHDFSINTLRHSVATFHNDCSPLSIKSYVSYLLQHTEKQHIQYIRASDKVKKLPLVESFKETEPVKKFKYLGERCAVRFTRKKEKPNKYIELGEIVLSAKSTETYRIVFNNKNTEETHFVSFNNIDDPITVGTNNIPVITIM
jgi:hypothetical protein